MAAEGGAGLSADGSDSGKVSQAVERELPGGEGARDVREGDNGINGSMVTAGGAVA